MRRDRCTSYECTSSAKSIFFCFNSRCGSASSDLQRDDNLLRLYSLCDQPACAPACPTYFRSIRSGSKVRRIEKVSSTREALAHLSSSLSSTRHSRSQCLGHTLQSIRNWPDHCLLSTRLCSGHANTRRVVRFLTNTRASRLADTNAVKLGDIGYIDGAVWETLDINVFELWQIPPAINLPAVVERQPVLKGSTRVLRVDAGITADLPLNEAYVLSLGRTKAYFNEQYSSWRRF